MGQWGRGWGRVERLYGNRPLENVGPSISDAPSLSFLNGGSRFAVWGSLQGYQMFSDKQIESARKTA